MSKMVFLDPGESFSSKTRLISTVSKPIKVGVVVVVIVVFVFVRKR